MEKKQTNQDNSLTVKTVGLNPKQSAAFLVPDYMEGQQLAVVDEGVLKYLKSLLPKANAYEIIDEFIKRMEIVRNHPCTLGAAVKEAKDFVAFHETVNLLNVYFNPQTKVIREKPFNIEMELTLDELVDKKNQAIQMVADLEALIQSHPDWMKPKQEVVVVDTPR